MADIGTDSFIQVKKDDWDNLNRALRYIYNQLDAITGRRGLGADPTQKYTPNISNLLNLTAAESLGANFVRVLDTVIVFGELHVQPTAGSTQCRLFLSLPIPSKFTAEGDLGGAGFCPGSIFGTSFLADVASGNATVLWVSTDTALRRVSYVFAYHVY